MIFVLVFIAGIAINSVNADVRNGNDLKYVIVDTFNDPQPADWTKLNNG